MFGQEEERTFAHPIAKYSSSHFGSMLLLYLYENHDLAIARSSSSHADFGLRVAFKCLNV